MSNPTQVLVYITENWLTGSTVGIVQECPHPSAIAAVSSKFGVDVSNHSAIKGKVRFADASLEPKKERMAIVEILSSVSSNDHLGLIIKFVSFLSFASNTDSTQKVLPSLFVHLNNLVPSIVPNYSFENALFPDFVDLISLDDKYKQIRSNNSLLLLHLCSVDADDLRGHTVAILQEDLCVYNNGALVSLVESPNVQLSVTSQANQSSHNFLYTVIRQGNFCNIISEIGPHSEKLFNLTRPSIGHFLDFSDSLEGYTPKSSHEIISYPRKDLTHLQTISFYDEVEDNHEACSFEQLDNDRIALYLHNADVASLIVPNSELDLLFASRKVIVKNPNGLPTFNLQVQRQILAAMEFKGGNSTKEMRALVLQRFGLDKMYSSNSALMNFAEISERAVCVRLGIKRFLYFSKLNHFVASSDVANCCVCEVGTEVSVYHPFLRRCFPLQFNVKPKLFSEVRVQLVCHKGKVEATVV
ncbi:hypothetical protein RCL1_001182 [Eukaryota sp. TZLM3-RCL]